MGGLEFRVRLRRVPQDVFRHERVDVGKGGGRLTDIQLTGHDVGGEALTVL